MTTRTSCIVPFCRRTTATDKLRAKGHNEWICTDHWRSVDPRLRRLKSRAERKLARGTGDPVTMRGIIDRTWTKVKAKAIEAAAGLG